jgi:hypothetical protein
MLSDWEISHFRQSGFVVPSRRLPADDVAALQALIMEVVAERPGMRNKPITDAHMPRRRSDGSEGSLLPFCVRDDILEMIERLEGPDLLLWTTTVFHRPPIDGMATPWHQDGQYWPIEPLSGTSAWVATTPCTRANGCLRVIPGSHREARPHQRSEAALLFGRTVATHALDERDAVEVELEPGQMILFHPLLVHGSWPNTSTLPRTGFVMRYIPSTSFFNHDSGEKRASGVAPYADRALFLVRGVNHCPRNNLTRNHVEYAS